jgi:phosphodiesterase/alkaline phosphatase D-like protein
VDFTCAGRLKTLQQGDVSNVRFAVVSCSNFPAGYFNAYKSIADQTVDLVLHVGDYIYEYKDGEYATNFADNSDASRKPAPNVDLVQVSDYRYVFICFCSFSISPSLAQKIGVGQTVDLFLDVGDCIKEYRGDYETEFVDMVELEPSVTKGEETERDTDEGSPYPCDYGCGPPSCISLSLFSCLL